MACGKGDGLSLLWLCYKLRYKLYRCYTTDRLRLCYKYVSHTHTCTHTSVLLVSTETLLLALALKKQATVMCPAYYEKGWVVGNCRWPIGTEGLSPTIERTELCQQQQAWKRTPALNGNAADGNLTAASRGAGRRPHAGTPDPWNCHNTCVLF